MDGIYLNPEEDEINLLDLLLVLLLLLVLFLLLVLLAYCLPPCKKTLNLMNP